MKTNYLLINKKNNTCGIIQTTKNLQDIEIMFEADEIRNFDTLQLLLNFKDLHNYEYIGFDAFYK